MRFLTVLLHAVGVALTLLGVLVLLAAFDLLPLELVLSEIDSLNTGPKTSYYRVIKVDQSSWADALLMVGGVALCAVGWYILRKRR